MTKNDACENDIHIYCLPPHTTNRAQLLDKSVFKSVKASCNQHGKGFMRDNSHKVITQYDCCRLFCDVFLSVQTTGNIISGFKSTGIYPYNLNAVTAEHLQFSSVNTELQFQDDKQTPPSKIEQKFTQNRIT